MNLKTMKKLYKTGKWIAVCRQLGVDKLTYAIVPNCTFTSTVPNVWALVHRKHAHILDAFLDGCEVYFVSTQLEPVFSEKLTKIDFIEDYDEDASYRVVPKTLENCYCEATELHFNEVLKADEYRIFDCVKYHSNDKWYLWTKEGWSITFSEEINSSYNKIEWNKQINSWVYCPKESEYGITQLDDNTTTVSDKLNNFEDIVPWIPDTFVCKGGVSTCTPLSKNPKINNFESYGFTAGFEGEIDNVYKDSMNVLHGRLVKDNRAIRWNHKGICINHPSLYKLTPIVKEVYPMFKKDHHGTIHRIDKEGSAIKVLMSNPEFIGMDVETVCCSCEDVQYDAKRGLYHGQPCFINWHETHRIVFYIGNGVFRDRYQDYDEGFGEFASYRQIPLKTLQHMSWVWEQYKALEL